MNPRRFAQTWESFSASDPKLVPGSPLYAKVYEAYFCGGASALACAVFAAKDDDGDGEEACGALHAEFREFVAQNRQRMERARDMEEALRRLRRKDGMQ
jgi:hypothetical protein